MGLPTLTPSGSTIKQPPRCTSLPPSTARQHTAHGPGRLRTASLGVGHRPSLALPAQTPALGRRHTVCAPTKCAWQDDHSAPSQDPEAKCSPSQGVPRGHALGVPGGFLRRIAGGVVGALSSWVLLGGGVDSGALAGESLTIMLPLSPLYEVTRVQRALVETWGIVREAFVDPSFNNQDWDDRLQHAVEETFEASTADEAYDSIRTMLASLDDPFTRIVTAREYESFRINSDGALQGVGLVLATEPDTGGLIVIAPIEGGPADRAGILPGDELLEIDNSNLQGMDPQDAAKLLRGEAGTSVTLKLKRDDVGSSSEGVTEVVLRREMISLSPVYATLLPHQGANGSTELTGYIRLAAFSQNAAQDMQRAIVKLEKQGASSYILDLRNNPGGLVRAGLDVAQMWLDGTSPLVNTVDRFGDVQTISAEDASLHALTQRPLAVLVNHGSASASEILAGALHDNGRAMLVGETTYGKGRIQSVFELSDGTALFVTVAKYLSPALHEIDRVGLSPDLSCGMMDPKGALAAPSKRRGEIKSASSFPDQSSLRRDVHQGAEMPRELPMVHQIAPFNRIVKQGTLDSQQSAFRHAGGVPGKPAALIASPAAAIEQSPLSFKDEGAGSLVQELQDDICVLTAERQLEAESRK